MYMAFSWISLQSEGQNIISPHTWPRQ